ncbi:MAG TPA: SDR family NAD(P)-dependent oxidoreductase [Casimicrobiaceae bacterium]|nr:SDR family NAD(P)-dependent oxidoreductase [Casimicrobiaceae bacterium]
MNKPLVAIVTGAAHGLGRAIAETLATRGYAVAVADIDLAGAQAVCDGIAGHGGRAAAFQLDVAVAAEVSRVFADVNDTLGLPALLVNNAGIYPDDVVLDMPEASWDRVIAVNLKGTFLCAQAFARACVTANAKGVIVNLASTAAFSARVGAAHYSASKAGVVMLTKSLAHELAPQGIRVNAVAPGLIEVEGERVSAEYKRNVLPNIPAGRVGQPEDIAQTVAFLASDAADFINGACLPVDGGFLTGRKLIRAGSR